MVQNGAKYSHIPRFPSGSTDRISRDMGISFSMLVLMKSSPKKAKSVQKCPNLWHFQNFRPGVLPTNSRDSGGQK